MQFSNLQDFYYQYQKPLSACMHEIEKVGILTDTERLATFSGKLTKSLDLECQKIENLIHKKVIAKKKNSKEKTDKSILNLSAPTQLMAELKNLGLKIPTKHGRDTTDETALQRLYASSGHPVLQSVLVVRELNKLDGYAKTGLCDHRYLSVFPPCGTVGGRRSSRASWQSDQRSKISIGGNLQNFPKHSDLGMEFRECFISRPGYVFISCDQKSADDWTINGIIADLTGDETGIKELQGKISRHTLLAAKLFSKSIDQILKSGMEYYLAKKTRYAGTFGMWGKTMSEQLAKEARFFPKDACDTLLREFHSAEPKIIQVFQRYIEHQLNTKKFLRTPIGRERYFYGLRSFADNNTIYREGYSYIPLSTTGDNNGLAIISIYPRTSLRFYVIQEIHDSITMECEDQPEAIQNCCNELSTAFDRKIIFQNGFTMQIPIEFEIGYDMKNMKSFNSVEELGQIYAKLNRQSRQDLEYKSCFPMHPAFYAATAS